MDYDVTKIESQFTNEFIPRLETLGVRVGEVVHDESRSVVTLVVDLPVKADAALRRQVAKILADFEEECFLAVVTDVSFRYAGELEPVGTDA
jgi:hypothetical protein